MVKQTEGVDKRSQILATALKLFNSQGFHGTSTASIAKAAGVATGTLFHHFPSKEALLEILFLSVKQEFANALGAMAVPEGELKQQARTLWLGAIDWGMENPDKQQFFQQFSLSVEIPLPLREEAMQGILGFIGAMILEGQKRGVIAALPLPLLLENCHGQYLSASRFFLDRPALARDETHREASFQLFWNALRP
ncbi:TetR/AcrR family transcriptional regulator [Shewanella sp. JM162201]|uniref:TetR/AcrR family transcriptional regulator n=1 Tax=Shewanella jiangmenensis TaxID=2837387 RepID=A0ABS5V3N4_9GAMM|nr:TetR/AcrR family transcriptional regulator [Shewanella jiangmenensis]MBT1443668.1 TetR/AcrR family transcriptional regulator [Shewanella jiangmenensis]